MSVVKPELDVIHSKDYEWSSEQAESIVALKSCFKLAQGIAHAKVSEQFIVFNEASNYAVGAT